MYTDKKYCTRGILSQYEGNTEEILDGIPKNTKGILGEIEVIIGDYKGNTREYLVLILGEC